jgi:hypothetical protein
MSKTMNDEFKESLIHKIKAAFEGKAKYPGDKNISVDDFELQGIVGKWQNLSYETLSTHHQLGFFTPEGLKYYLPAYMIAAIKYPEDIFGASIIHHLSPPRGVAWKTQTVTIGANFTKEQKAAIRAFFKAYQEIYPDSFWEDIGDQSSLLETWKRGVDYWQFYG